MIPQCLHRWMDLGETVHILHVDHEAILYCEQCDWTLHAGELWTWYTHHTNHGD